MERKLPSVEALDPLDEFEVEVRIFVKGLNKTDNDIDRMLRRFSRE